MTEEDLAEARRQMASRGFPADSASDDDIRNMIKGMADMFRNNAPVSSAQAATVILDGVKAGKWRILVGDDAHALDKAVRADPEGIYGEGGLDLQSLQR